MEAPWTLARLLDSIRGYFQAKGVDSPRLDAEVLLSHVLKKPRIYLYTHYDQPITDTERTAVRELCKRRALHEPIAYIVGHKEFYGYRIDVTKDVLIPRPETEQLVDIGKAFVRQSDERNERVRVLDIGTGSGAIAIAMASQEPRVNVVAIDACDKALAVARGNVERLGLGDRIELVHAEVADLTKQGERCLLDNQQPFDLILSNPPYIGHDELPSLAKSVANFEPHQALFAEEGGQRILQQVFDASEAWLAAEGLLAMEMAPRHASWIASYRSSSWQTQVKRDLAGHERISVSRRLASKQVAPA